MLKTAAKVGQQLVGRGAVCCLSGGSGQKLGRDPSTLGLSREPEAKVISVDLAKVAGRGQAVVEEAQTQL